MSQLGDNVELEVRRGEIVIRDAKDPRAGWSEQIRVLLAKYGDPADEFGDLTHLNDDLDELTWDGPSFEEWRQGAKD